MELKRVPQRSRWPGLAPAQLILALMLAISPGISARTNKRQMATNKLPATDAEKIADALRAGPSFITKDATILDWPSTEGGEYRVLRTGTNDWTCLPAFPGYSHDEPGCFDPAFMSWVKQSLRARSPISIGSASRTCTLAPGFRMSPGKQTPRHTNFTSGHTS
jgi:hypothetical protein